MPSAVKAYMGHVSIHGLPQHERTGEGKDIIFVDNEPPASPIIIKSLTIPSPDSQKTSARSSPVPSPAFSASIGDKADQPDLYLQDCISSPTPATDEESILSASPPSNAFRAAGAADMPMQVSPARLSLTSRYADKWKQAARRAAAVKEHSAFV
jgi:hypothetical protein